MVVYRYCEGALRVVLTYDVLVEEGLEVSGFIKLKEARRGVPLQFFSGIGNRVCFFDFPVNDGLTNGYTGVTNGDIRRACNHFADFFMRLSTERAEGIAGCFSHVWMR
jgi:hypothetical protein